VFTVLVQRKVYHASLNYFAGARLYLQSLVPISGAALPHQQQVSVRNEIEMNESRGLAFGWVDNILAT